MKNDDDLKEATLGEDATLLDVLWALDRGAASIVLIVRRDGTLGGVMTDGDVRRALLSGAATTSPASPHVVRTYFSVLPSVTRNEVIEVMRARSIGQVPIVDDGGRLVGLHTLHRLLGRTERKNAALILAGGLGSRLRPLTNLLPKPMVHVAGRPILERTVLQLVGYGFRDVFVAVHYLGDVIERHFGDGQRFGCRITYLREERPLGTAGCLSLLPRDLGHPVLMMNGDLVTQARLGDMVDVHERDGSEITVGARRYTHDVPFGCLEIDPADNATVKSLVEKPRVTLTINAGIYVVSPSVIARVTGQEPMQMPDLISGAISAGRQVRAFRIEDDWIDVGEKEQLAVANGSLRSPEDSE